MRKAFTLSLFLLAIAGILYVGNWVVYEAVVLLFGITGTTPLGVLGGGLDALSASFIFATLLGNWYYNRFTRAFYTFAAVWMGFFAYFFFASVLYIVVSALAQPSLTSGLVLFVLAGLLGIYGIVQARKIVVTEINVSLPNLPLSWKGRRAVWLSDVHLGQLHGLSFARKIVAQVATLAPDIIFVGGDLYDGTGAPDISELTAPLADLVAPHGVYFITGNHEEFGDCTQFLAAVAGAGMRVLQDELVDLDGLQLIGVDYQHARDTARFEDILAKLALDPDRASILLKHEPKDLGIAAAAGISLQVSGHTHNGQMWPFGYIAQLAYNGYGYGLKRFQQMQVYVSSGTGTWGPPMRVGTRSEIVLFTFE